MFVNAVTHLSMWAVPFIMFIILIHGYIKGVKIFEVFVDGAKEGLMIAVKIIPFIIGIYVAVGIFRESGAIYLFIKLIDPILKVFHIPGEILLVSITRSLSGPAALGMAMEVFDTYGPDSLFGRMAAAVVGSTDTTFYIIAIYFASIGVKKTKYAIPVGLMADFAAFLGAVYIVERLYG
ncbi:MAG: spore maturation protein [Thermosediminibacterales bacterium]|nr:spore maturation protein [Thermosediminibacterales bacterium]